MEELKQCNWQETVNLKQTTMQSSKIAWIVVAGLIKRSASNSEKQLQKHAHPRCKHNLLSKQTDYNLCN